MTLPVSEQKELAAFYRAFLEFAWELNLTLTGTTAALGQRRKCRTPWDDHSLLS